MTGVVAGKGPYRGPTKDYREFEGTYRGRGHSFSRIMLTNTRQILTSVWTIVIIIISFLFLFFPVLSLVFGGAVEESTPMDEWGELEPDVHFEIVPVDDQASSMEVIPGKTYTLKYEITNIGEDPTVFHYIPLYPNEMWDLEVSAEGGTSLDPGDSSVLEMDVKVPDTFENFSRITEMDPFLTLGGNFAGERVVDSRDDGGFPGGTSDEERPPAMNRIYEYDNSRFVGVGVVPDALIDEIMEFGISSYDVRISSIATLLVLDDDDPTVMEWLALDEEAEQPSFDISIKGNTGGIPVKKMESPASSEMIIVIQNKGEKSVTLGLDALLLPVSDPTMSIVFVLDDMGGDPAPVLEVPGGETIEIQLEINTGRMPYRTYYPFVIAATEISPGTVHRSETVDAAVSVTGSSFEEEAEGEKYHNILWGGGFNYERYLWVILLAAFGGAGLIAKDMRENSISLYLSRPITWYDYLSSKFLSLFIVLSTITMVPAVILFTTGMAFSNNDLSFILDNLYLLPGMFGSYAIALVVFGSVSIAFSSYIERWILAGVAIFTFFIFSSIISDILFSIFEKDYLRLLNLNYVMKNLFRPMFGMKYDPSVVGLEWYVPALFLAGLVFICWLLVVFRFRKREVAK